MTQSAINHRPSFQATVSLPLLSSHRHTNTLCPSSMHNQWPHASSSRVLLLLSSLSSSYLEGTINIFHQSPFEQHGVIWASELEFKGKLLTERQRTRWLSLILEDKQQREYGCGKGKQQERGNVEKRRDFSDINSMKRK